MTGIDEPWNAEKPPPGGEGVFLAPNPSRVQGWGHLNIRRPREVKILMKDLLTVAADGHPAFGVGAIDNVVLRFVLATVRLANPVVSLDAAIVTFALRGRAVSA